MKILVVGGTGFIGQKAKAHAHKAICRVAVQHQMVRNILALTEDKGTARKAPCTKQSRL